MYYIAPADNCKNDVVIYTLKKRISDFKADDDVQYVVYRSKTDMREGSGWFPYYIGKNGKLNKSKTEGFMRFGGCGL
jgi:hypothetical protein